MMKLISIITFLARIRLSASQSEQPIAAGAIPIPPVNVGEKDVIECKDGKKCFLEDFMPDIDLMRRKINDAVNKRKENPEISWRELVPHKDNDIWTASDELRSDLESMFQDPQLAPLREGTILELGSYVGYTSRFFSYLFKSVIAVDIIPDFLMLNEWLNRDRTNIMTLQMKIYDAAYENNVFQSIARNAIQVAYVDASHDTPMVVRDLARITLLLPTVQMIIFDDFGAEAGVREAFGIFESRGVLRPIAELGKQPPWYLSDGRLVNHTEALACMVNPSVDVSWAGPAIGLDMGDDSL